MVKINEVAKAAGVSISTVSYALSGKRPVAPDTRKRIQAAVLELGYSPNAGARMLAGSRTHIFALTEPLRKDTHAPTHMAFVLATAVAARRNDYDILLLTDEQASAGMGRVASSGLVDAILVLDVAPDDERVALSRAIDTPTIFIGVPDDHEGLICVDLDFDAAAGPRGRSPRRCRPPLDRPDRTAAGRVREVELPPAGAPRLRSARGRARHPFRLPHLRSPRHEPGRDPPCGRGAARRRSHRAGRACRRRRARRRAGRTRRARARGAGGRVGRVAGGILRHARTWPSHSM